MSGTEKKDKGGDKNFVQSVGPYLGLGLQLAATVVVMVFVGIWLDGKFSTTPYLTIVCSLLGIFAALYNFLKTVIKSDK